MNYPENKYFQYIPTSPQPIGLWKLKDSIANLDINYWINQCYKISETYPSERKSNVRGYQSPDSLHKHPNFINLVSLLRNSIFLLTQNSNYTLAGLWVNISFPGSYNGPHNHGTDPEQTSGVLYLKTPPDCGHIGFINPYNPNRLTEFHPTKGDLLLFPSPLDHLVTPNYSEEDRISIAFNCQH